MEYLPQGLTATGREFKVKDRIIKTVSGLKVNDYLDVVSKSGKGAQASLNILPDVPSAPQVILRGSTYALPVAVFTDGRVTDVTSLQDLVIKDDPGRYTIEGGTYVAWIAESIGPGDFGIYHLQVPLSKEEIAAKIEPILTQKRITPRYRPV